LHVVSLHVHIYVTVLALCRSSDSGGGLHLCTEYRRNVSTPNLDWLTDYPDWGF